MSSTSKAVSLRISAIVHATEESKKVIQAIRNVYTINDSAALEATRAKGHHGNQITTLALLEKNPRIADRCVRDIWNRLSSLDKETVLSSLSMRVDGSGALFLRIDKQEAFKGSVRLYESDPIKVSISFRAARSKQDDAVDNVRKFLTQISAVVAGSD